MRLTAEEVDAIKAAAREAFGPDAVVRLFGSRVRDDLKGGDIDLHVEVGETHRDIGRVSDFRWHLFRRIAERKIDIVLHGPDQPVRPIDHVAHAEGLVL